MWGGNGIWVQWINTGGLKQKHKKQPFNDAGASHLSLVLRHVWFQPNHINHKPQTKGTVLLVCLWHMQTKRTVPLVCSETCQRHVPTLWRYRFWEIGIAPFQEIILSLGVFRRETASGFYPWCKVEGPRRGWRRDCVVGGMETRFQWRKAHNRTAKCEAFHVAPRLFFMFLSLILFTIRQQCRIYHQKFSTEMEFAEMGNNY